MWLLGLASLAAVLVLQGRLDQRRQEQLAVANISGDGLTADELIHRADQRLYDDKRSSRPGPPAFAA